MATWGTAMGGGNARRECEEGNARWKVGTWKSRGRDWPRFYTVFQKFFQPIAGLVVVSIRSELPYLAYTYLGICVCQPMTGLVGVSIRSELP